MSHLSSMPQPQPQPHPLLFAGLSRRTAIWLSLTCLLTTLTAFIASEADAEAGTSVVAVTTDWATGGLSALSTELPESPQIDLALICPDAVAREFSGLLYVVNRFGCGSIQVVDPAQGFRTIREFSTGTRSNPQDIAFISSDRAFVSRYDNNWLLEVNAEQGTVTDSIDLSLFADDDGLPEMYTMELVAPYLYVTLQRLNRRDFQPSNVSMIAVIDTRNNVLVDTDPTTPKIDAISLHGRNPFGRMEVTTVGSSQQLLVATAGSFSDRTDGGLEAVDLGTWRSEGFLIEGQQLGGDLLDFVTYSPERIFAIVADEENVTSLVAFGVQEDRSPEIIARSIPPTGQQTAYHFFDCLLTRDGQLYVADRHPEAPGIRIFNPESGSEQTLAPISTGLPPFSLLELPQPGEPPVLIPPPIVAYPNPTSTGVDIAVTAPGRGVGRIFDLYGREVRTLDISNEGLAYWDGEDAQGRPARSGRYWIVVPSADGTSKSQSIQVVR